MGKPVFPTAQGEACEESVDKMNLYQDATAVQS